MPVPAQAALAILVFFASAAAIGGVIRSFGAAVLGLAALPLLTLALIGRTTLHSRLLAAVAFGLTLLVVVLAWALELAGWAGRARRRDRGRPWRRRAGPKGDLHR